MDQTKIEAIARVCHEANRAYCASLGDMSQLSWDLAPQWQKQSAILGVMFHLENPNSVASDSHANWTKVKVAEGWVYGEKKDPNANPPTHHCLVPFEQLPVEQQLKDHLFLGIVRALTAL